MSSTHNLCFSHHHYQTWCHQIFFVNNIKIFVTPSIFKLQKWFLHQNGVELNQKSKADDSGPLYKVTWQCLAVPDLPKALLKMASGLISPSEHCGQLCDGALHSTNINVLLPRPTLTCWTAGRCSLSARSHLATPGAASAACLSRGTSSPSGPGSA